MGGNRIFDFNITRLGYRFLEFDIPIKKYSKALFIKENL